MPSDLPVVVFRPGAEEEKILLEIATDLGVSKSRAIGYALRQYAQMKKEGAETVELVRKRPHTPLRVIKRPSGKQQPGASFTPGRRGGHGH
jgi:hypothetical protein